MGVSCEDPFGAFLEAGYQATSLCHGFAGFERLAVQKHCSS
jgi:hypothetical protein